MYTWSTLMMQNGNSYIGSQFIGTAAETWQFQKSSLQFRCPQHVSNFNRWTQFQLEDGWDSKWTLQWTDASSLLEMESCGLRVLHGAYKTSQSVTSWKLDKFLENFFYFQEKVLPAYLKHNDLFALYEGKDTSHLFPLSILGIVGLKTRKQLVE